jgi:type IV secretion system protein VirB5
MRDEGEKPTAGSTARDSRPILPALSSNNVYSNPADHTELKRKRWTATFTYVFRENVKNNELAVNPLGLTIVRFRADQAFS